MRKKLLLCVWRKIFEATTVTERDEYVTDLITGFAELDAWQEKVPHGTVLVNRQKLVNAFRMHFQVANIASYRRRPGLWKRMKAKWLRR